MIASRMTARWLVGKNRIVMTHLDDCCSVRGLTGVSIQLNGAPAGNCM